MFRIPPGSGRRAPSAAQVSGLFDPRHGQPTATNLIAAYTSKQPPPLASGSSVHGGCCARESCMYRACTPNIQVRDVCPDVHQALVRRAALAGQSLQQFLTGQLARIAATPTLDEVLDRIEGRGKGRLSAAEVLDALEADSACR